MATEIPRYARRRRRSESSDYDYDDDSMTPTSPAPSFTAEEAETPKPNRKPSLLRRQSSFAKPRAEGTPRTPNRVHFDIQEPGGFNGAPKGQTSPLWADDDEIYSLDGSGSPNGHAPSQRLGLLTGLEAPSVTVASGDEEFNAEDLLESARPRSGMKAAFMNMANSIM